MTAALHPSPLLPFTGGAQIPEALKRLRRWAPWSTQWLPKARGGQGKWDKRPALGLSTGKPETWLSYEDALAEFNRQPGRYAGLGFVTTGQSEYIGVDLDRCVEDGQIAPWAQEIVDQLGSYAEVSPSGRGLRIWLAGAIASDWTNHEVGIEVYGGNTSRFLTTTGAHLPNTPAEVRAAPDSALRALETRYARERTKADAVDAAMPDIIDDALLPSPENLTISKTARDYLQAGTTGEDRSDTLFKTALSLANSALNEAEVFSVLVHNEHAWNYAFEKRRHDSDKALLYLWKHYAHKAHVRVRAERAEIWDAFDVIPESPPAADDPADVYIFQQAQEFVDTGKPPGWHIKRVLPQTSTCILYGPSGSGKTFITLDMVAAIARGVEWRGRRVKQSRVAYICAEGVSGFRQRLKAYAAHNGLALSSIPINVFGGAPSLLDVADVRKIIRSLNRLGTFGVIVVDTLAQVTAGADENSSADMSRALKNAAAMHQATGATVILVAHTGKNVAAGVRGWSGQKGAADTQIEVIRSGDDRAVIIEKQKDGPGEGDEYGFRLVTVVTGIDEDGDEITSCVVEPTVAIPQAERKKEITGRFQILTMRALQKLTQQSRGEGVFYADLLSAVVNEVAWDPNDGKRDTRRQQAQRAVESLQAANRIGLHEGRLVPL